MSTTLPLFWDLSAAAKQKRLKASSELITALERFQLGFEAGQPSSAGGDADMADDDAGSDDDGSDDDESGEEVDESEDEDDEETNEVDLKEAKRLDKALDRQNSEDVRYSIRRLVRGLASSRESSRLGFAVALTELLSRLETITPQQIISIVLRFSHITVSIQRQEVRDLLFARLFGLTSVVQSQLLYRSSATLVDFQMVLTHLIAVGAQKSWLRESCWWAVICAVQGLEGKELAWKEEGIKWLAEFVFNGEEAKEWTAEKVALAVKLQKSYPSLPWKSLYAPSFKHASILHPSNLPTLAKVLRDTAVASDEDDEDDVEPTAGPSNPGTGSWKPNPPFVWDLILDLYFPPGSDQSESSGTKDRASFSDFYRIAVDESLFDAKASAERKYWGFQIFIKALPRLPSSEIPLIFTPNFMRVWINNLSGEERYLHKAALAIAQLVQSVTATNPTVGFTLLSQLLGKNGNRNFDKITKTKTVSGIMASLSAEGVQDFVDYLKGLVNESQAGPSLAEFDYKQVDARRTWIFDQLVSLIKNTTVPKTDAWVSSVLEFFVVHGLFSIKSANKKSPLATLHTVSHPALSDAVHASSRTRLSSILGELSTESTLVKGADGKTKRAVGCDSTGKLWTSRALDMVAVLEKDTKHVRAATEDVDEVVAARKSAQVVLKTLEKVPAAKREAARGLELIIQSVILQSYDDAEGSLDVLEELEGCATKMFAEKPKATKKKKAAEAEDEDEDEDLEPIDILVDVLIGFLEKSSSQLRALASQVFGVLSGEATESTIDLLLAQLETRPITTDEDDHEGEFLDEDEDEEMEEDEGDEDEEESDEGEDSGLDEEDADGDVDPEMRKRIAEVLQVNGASADQEAGDDSDDESEDLMNDEDMMAMDDKLVEIFKMKTDEKKGKKDAQREATHFKNRVLELVETFLKKQPTSSLVLRLVLPLLDLVLHGSPNEAHLTSKVTGILQSRMFKAKEPLEIADRAEAIEVLETLHVEARQASSAQTAKLCSQAIIFVSRALLADRQASSSSATQDLSAPVVEAYTKSLDDFMTKKSTKVRSSLFSDLAVRFPVVAWSLRKPLVQYAKSDGANSYRQTQAFNLLNDLVSQLPSLSKAGLTAEIQTFIPDCREAIYTILETTASLEGAKALKTDRLRDILKFALKLARASKTFLPSSEEFSAAWAADSLPAIVDALKKSDKLKSSKGLLSSVDQLAQIVAAVPGGKAKGSKKAKKDDEKKATKTVAAVEESSVDATVPSKRKKAAAPAAEDGAKKTKKKSKKSAE